MTDYQAINPEQAAMEYRMKEIERKTVSSRRDVSSGMSLPVLLSLLRYTVARS